MFGGQKQFEHQQERDYALRKYCKEHKIKLIEIPYTEYGNVEELLSKELLKFTGHNLLRPQTNQRL